MVIVFFLLGTLPLVTALIGFLFFNDSLQPRIAGVVSTKNIVEKINLEQTITITLTPTPYVLNSPTPGLVEINKEEISEKVIEVDNNEEVVVENKVPQTYNLGSGDLLTQINNFRIGKGLGHLSSNSETCFFANIRAQEISSSFNHDGFRNRIDSGSLPYPSYSEVAENIAMNSDPNAVVPAWINSPGHNANLSKSVPFGCVVGSGAYYVFEAWRP